MKIEVSIRVSEMEAYTSREIALARTETQVEWDAIASAIDSEIEDVRLKVNRQLRGERQRREVEIDA